MEWVRRVRRVRKCRAKGCRKSRVMDCRGKKPWEVAEADSQFSPRRCSHADLCPHAPQHRSPRPREWGHGKREPENKRLKSFGGLSTSQPHRPLFSSLRTLGSA